MVVWQQQHARSQQDPSGGRGDEAQAIERIGDRQRRWDLGGPDPRTRIEHDVLRQVQRFEAASLGVLGVGDDLVRVDAVVGRVVADRELHHRLHTTRQRPSSPGPAVGVARLLGILRHGFGGSHSRGTTVRCSLPGICQERCHTQPHAAHHPTLGSTLHRGWPAGLVRAAVAAASRRPPGWRACAARAGAPGPSPWSPASRPPRRRRRGPMAAC
jgi:hypothetical protein